MRDKCKSCKFYQFVGEVGNSKGPERKDVVVGLCLRYAPSPTVVEGSSKKYAESELFYAKWPIVWEKHWCGEWKDVREG